MMMKLKKAEGSLIMNKFIIIVLVALVVVGGIFALWKIDIGGKLKDFLPFYGGDSDEVDLPEGMCLIESAKWVIEKKSSDGSVKDVSSEGGIINDDNTIVRIYAKGNQNCAGKKIEIRVIKKDAEGSGFDYPREQFNEKGIMNRVVDFHKRTGNSGNYYFELFINGIKILKQDGKEFGKSGNLYISPEMKYLCLNRATCVAVPGGALTTDIETPESKEIGELIEGKENIATTEKVNEYYYIFLNNDGSKKQTQLYYGGSSILASVSGKDIVVANIRENKVDVIENFFDASSKEFNDIRMKVGDDFWNVLAQLDNSVYVDGHVGKDYKQGFFKGEGDKTELIGKRPGVFKIGDIVNLDATTVGSLDWNKGELTLFFPGMNFVGKVNRLYLRQDKEYIIIFGNLDWDIDKELGRIYPDGSIWFDDNELGIMGVKINRKTNYNKYFKPYYESNIKIDYNEVLKILKNKK